MNHEFWNQKWQKNEIGFHESKPNPLLVSHFKKLELAKKSRVFLPLCGKTLDIAWLLSEGHQVVGAELSELAIEQLFTELGVEPKITDYGSGSRYSAKNIDIYVGDIFDLSRELIGPIDAIYDRAALVALPDEMRERYTWHLTDITGTADQLLISFEYDQNLMNGPPFSISSDDVKQHYNYIYNITLLETVSVVNGLKGICAANEQIWLLKKLDHWTD